jgi:hypothetical protein
MRLTEPLSQHDARRQRAAVVRFDQSAVAAVDQVVGVVGEVEQVGGPARHVDGVAIRCNEHGRRRHCRLGQQAKLIARANALTNEYSLIVVVCARSARRCGPHRAPLAQQLLEEGPLHMNGVSATSLAGYQRALLSLLWRWGATTTASLPHSLEPAAGDARVMHGVPWVAVGPQ